MKSQSEHQIDPAPGQNNLAYDVFAIFECVAYRQIKWYAWKKQNSR